MDLLPSADELALVHGVEDYLSAQLSTTHLRERLRSGRDVEAAAYADAGELGIFSLGLPEASGGAGAPVVEEALVFRALGRHLAPVGFLAQVLAARLADAAGDDVLRDALAEGREPVAAALVDPRDGDALRVFDLTSARHVLRCADDALALLPSTSLPTARRMDCLDPATTMDRVQADGLPAALELTGAAGEQLLLLGALLSSAMLVGIAEAARDASVLHAKERTQFGKPIGVNQAIKHPCADMATRCEAAGALVSFAALALRDGRADAGFQVAAAKRVATSAAYENTRSNVQVHGGMGVTWEHDAHLLVSRTHVLDLLFGDVRQQQVRLLAGAPAVP